MSDMFEYLEAIHREDDTPFRNSAAVSIDRAERKYGSFLSGAQGNKEFNSRMDLVRDDINKIASDVCEEFGYDDSEHIASLVLGQLEMLSARNSDSAKTDSVGEIEKQDLKSQDPEGYYTEPSPKLNPGSSGDNMKNTNPAIAELTPDEKQDPTDSSWPHDAEISGYANLVDADKPMQPENHVGDSTMTFPNKGQADPVTSSKKKSEVLDQTQDFGDYPAVIEKIKDMFRTGMSMVDVMGAFGDKLRSWGVTEQDLRPMLYEQQHQNRLDMQQEVNFAKDFGGFVGSNKIDPNNPEEVVEYLSKKSSVVKHALDNMDFKSFAENMTPSEAISELIGSGVPEHQAKDSVDWYVNHINPGWAHKNWTSSVEKESDMGEIRPPQNAMEEKMIEFETKKFQQQIEDLVAAQIEKIMNGPEKNTFWETADGGRITLSELFENGQLEAIVRNHIMSMNPDSGVKGINSRTNGVHIVPLTTGREMNVRQQKAMEESAKRVGPKQGPPAIGDRAIERAGLGLEPKGERGPYGGPAPF